MITEINGNSLEIQDTGAPRGERNMWYVTLNGVQLYFGGNRRKAEDLHDILQEALESTKRGRWQP